jgi:hypothetical protein
MVGLNPNFIASRNATDEKINCIYHIFLATSFKYTKMLRINLFTYVWCSHTADFFTSSLDNLYIFIIILFYIFNFLSLKRFYPVSVECDTNVLCVLIQYKVLVVVIGSGL